MCVTDKTWHWGYVYKKSRSKTVFLRHCLSMTWIMAAFQLLGLHVSFTLSNTLWYTICVIKSWLRWIILLLLLTNVHTTFTSTWLCLIFKEKNNSCWINVTSELLILHYYLFFGLCFRVYGFVSTGIILPHEELLSLLMEYEVLGSICVASPSFRNL